jgi:hypothetical protein
VVYEKIFNLIDDTGPGIGGSCNNECCTITFSEFEVKGVGMIDNDSINLYSHVWD